MNRERFDIAKVEHMKFLILPGKCPPGSPYTDIYNKVYEFWKTTWQAVYRDAGSPESFVPDDFMRQDLIPVLLSPENDVVAIHLYTFFNLSTLATLDHHYFAFYPKEFVEQLRRRNATYVMSLEFLTANPEWRKSKTGISWSEIVAGLGFQIMRETDVDACIAPARRDVKVNETAYKFGGTCLIENVVKRNFSCDLVAIFRENRRDHPDPLMNNYIYHFWNKRIDAAGLTLQNHNLAKAA